MEFIEPDRSNYIVSAHKPNDEGVRDIGFVKGTFLDGRPYRLECWCMDELIMASVFFVRLTALLCLYLLQLLYSHDKI